MGKVFLVLLAIAVYLYAVIDVARSGRSEIRLFPKPIWLLIVILVPLLGSALWLMFGRVWVRPGRTRRASGPVAPDDDPRFLKQLDDEAWQRKMKQRREDEA